MIEKYIQIAKERNKCWLLLKEQDQTNENYSILFFKTLTLISLIPLLGFNLFFIYNLSIFNDFVENNGFESFISILKEPSLLNGDYSFLYSENVLSIISHYDKISQINFVFMVFFVATIIISLIKLFRIPKKEKELILSKDYWFVQCVFTVIFSVCIAISFVSLPSLDIFISSVELNVLDNVHHFAIQKGLEMNRDIGFFYIFSLALIPFLILIYSFSTYISFTNIKKNNTLQKNVKHKELKKQIDECEIKIKRMKKAIIVNDKNKSDIINRIKDANDTEEHEILMNVIESSFGSLTADQLKINLFKKTIHEKNLMENM